MELPTAYQFLRVRPGAPEPEVREAARIAVDAGAPLAQVDDAYNSIRAAGFPSQPWGGAPPRGQPPAPWQQQGYPMPPPQPKGNRAGVTIGLGALLLVIGIAVTAGTHEAAASAGGGTYIIAYGPIIIGIVSIFRGLMMLGSK